MQTHKIKIDGVFYANVGSIEMEPEEEYYYNVTSLSGKHYQKLRYRKTNYTVTFFNLLDGQYFALRNLALSDAAHSCGFPKDNGNYNYNYDSAYTFRDYHLTMKDEKLKGFLRSNQYFKNGLTIHFQEVDADE